MDVCRSVGSEADFPFLCVVPEKSQFVNTVPLYYADSNVRGLMALQFGTHLGPYEYSPPLVRLSCEPTAWRL